MMGSAAYCRLVAATWLLCAVFVASELRWRVPRGICVPCGVHQWDVVSLRQLCSQRSRVSVLPRTVWDVPQRDRWFLQQRRSDDHGSVIPNRVPCWIVLCWRCPAAVPCGAVRGCHQADVPVVQWAVQCWILLSCRIHNRGSRCMRRQRGVLSSGVCCSPECVCRVLHPGK